MVFFMEYALELLNVSKKYSNFQLDQVSFQVPRGHIVGFVGENGAGKTTCIKAIMNLIKLDDGEIRIFGKDYKENELEIKEQIGIVFDECCFHETFRTKDIDCMMSGIYKNWDSKMFYDYCRKFDLPQGKCIKEFSRGMKMKLSIAAALSHHAKLLILDEATSGLDPVVREEILDIFMDFIQDEEHTIFVSSHIISDLEKIADYIIFIHGGKVNFHESKDDLLEQYGVARITETQYQNLSPEFISRVRKSKFGVEVLTNQRRKLALEKPEYIVDSASIEEIILFMVKGEAS